MAMRTIYPYSQRYQPWADPNGYLSRNIRYPAGYSARHQVYSRMFGKLSAIRSDIYYTDWARYPANLIHRTTFVSTE